MLFGVAFEILYGTQSLSVTLFVVSLMLQDTLAIVGQHRHPFVLLYVDLVRLAKPGRFLAKG